MRGLVWIACAACASEPARVGNMTDAEPAGRSSHLESSWVVVDPHGPRFQVPPAWRERGVQLHLSRREIEQVHAGGDATLARIVDAVLPFEACAFAGGDDTQLRVYVLQEEASAVVERVRKRGRETARSLRGTFERGAASELDPWDDDEIRVDLEQPNGSRRPGFASFRIRALGAVTVVVVQMYRSPRTTVEIVLSSMSP